MKGALFSADFVKDQNGNIRLLELNTDTGITPALLNHIDFNGFFNILESFNITQLDVIYKQNIHINFVYRLEEYVQSNVNFITTFNKHEEPAVSIFPTPIEDADNKFILRLVYDETTIFDSYYCKQNDKLYKIFSDNSDLNSVAEFCLKKDGETINNIRFETNSESIPDLAVKNINNIHESIKFYKVGGVEPVNDNFLNFLNDIGDDKLITNYYETLDSQHQKSYRSFNIIYGPDLSVFNLTTVEVSSMLEKPSSITFDESKVINEIDEKHYYEFATNYPNPTKTTTYKGGVFEEELILDEFGLPVLISETVVGNYYKSLIVSGSPNTDDPAIYSEWFHPGSIPPETIETTSQLVNKVSENLQQKIINNITTEDESSFRAHSLQSILVYDTIKNGFLYKLIFDIEPGVDKLLKLDSSLINVASNYIEILDDSHKVYILDMEDVDTFILHNSQINVNVITHNACFPAGTKILLENGEYETIEKIKKDDILLSYNTENNKFESGSVGKIESSIQNTLIEIKTSGGESLKSTIGHTIYTTKGWKLAKNLVVGDELLNKKEEIVKITSLNVIKEDILVYHILNVNNTHNYFADDILVHNKSIGYSCFTYNTPVKMWDGTTRAIGEIRVGDYVLSYKDGDYVKGRVTDKLIHPTNEVVEVVKYKEMISDRFHPFYKNGEWNPICEANNVELDVQYVDNFYNLEIDGDLLFESDHNFIVEDLIVSGLGDNKLLNNTFKRQPELLITN
jgi:hypothetical protein